jgi:hypothetical protein
MLVDVHLDELHLAAGILDGLLDDRRELLARPAPQRGQPVDGFMGALPEGQIKAFIERLVGPLGPTAMFILTSFTLPPASLTAFSMIGVSCLHGPHHGAQSGGPSGLAT